MADITPITAIANAIAEVSKVLGQWLASADKRKMQAAIDAAEGYIFVNEKMGNYVSLPPEKKAAYLLHFKKRFFSHN